MPINQTLIFVVRIVLHKWWHGDTNSAIACKPARFLLNA